MCTIIAAVGMYPGLPLLVAGNRDENLDRAAEGPGVLWRDPVVVGPRDLVAGGTWIAVNAQGLVVALTNRFTGARPDPGRLSRGALVAESARAPSAADLHVQLAGLAHDRYNAFHLFYGDRQGAFFTAAGGGRVWQRELAAGLHVITERSDGEEPSARIDWVRELWPDAKQPDPAQLHVLLGRHDPDPARSLCVHIEHEGFRYGTRSTTIVFVPEGKPSLWHAEGPAHASRLEPRADLERLL